MVFPSAQHHNMSTIADGLDCPWLWATHKVSKCEHRQSGKVPYDIGSPSGREQATTQIWDLLATFTCIRAYTA